MTFNSAKLQDWVPELEQLDLGIGHPNHEMKEPLSRLAHGNRLEQAKDRQMAKCCLSALWLFHGYLDESHTLSQEIELESGSYLHGIMHRREGDFSNAKYWFRKAGPQAWFNGLEQRIADDSSIQQEFKAKYSFRFEASSLVDDVELAISKPKSAEYQSLSRITFWELKSIFEVCLAKAQFEMS